MRASSHSSSHNSYICGNAVEAMVGAFYIDHGYERAKQFIINRIIKQHFDINALVSSETNFKSRLIEWTQKYRIAIEFALVDTMADADNNPIFKTAIMLGDTFAADGTGYSKKESHQAASKITLDRLESDQFFIPQLLSTATN